MTELTVSQYINLASSLKIGDFIIYYFTIYFFIASIQRVLGFIVDTNGKLKTNPRILASLILVQIFYFLNTKLENIFMLNTYYGLLVITGLLFLICIYIFEKIFLSQKGLMKFFHKAHIMRVAKTKKKNSEIENRGKYEIDFSLVSVLAEDYSRRSKNIAVLIFIDLYICIILCFKLFNIDMVLGLVFIVYSILFIKTQINDLNKQAIDLAMNTHKIYLK